MISEPNVKFEDNGDVVIEGDEQKIEVSHGTAAVLACKLANLLGYKIKYEGIKIPYAGQANANSSKEFPLGK